MTVVPPFYVTTPIYYVNDVPHIGHAYTTVTADALARWHRLNGDPTFFLTGTDEHGLKVMRAAEANGCSPQDWADRTSARFREAWDLLDISYDDYIRTTEPRHEQAVQHLLQRVFDNGHIYKDTYSGLYCVACEAYYAAADLTDGDLCPTHNKPVEHLEEENWFFRLSAFAEPLMQWYEANPTAVAPAGKRNEALGIIRQGLDDVSISRTSIDWGVPVPWDPGHVFYVWYDALINYATAVGYGSDRERFDTWWPHVHHIIGKDILRFHCVYWPAMLLAAGEEPPANINVHGYLLVGGEKMSKTSLNQIFPADLVEVFGVDGYRHHFLRDQSFGPDGDFSFEGMVGRYNTDLANNLGNLLSRVSTVVAKKCGGSDPPPTPTARWRPWPPRWRPTPPGTGRRWRRRRRWRPPEPGARGQRPSRGQRAVEDGAGAGSRCCAWRRPRGPAHRVGAGQPGHAHGVCRGVEPHRPARHAHRSAVAGRRQLGRLPRGPAGAKGRPVVPPPERRWLTTLHHRAPPSGSVGWTVTAISTPMGTWAPWWPKLGPPGSPGW